MIVPKRYRNFDHEAIARDLAQNVPSLERVIVADGGGDDDFDALLTKPAWETEPDADAILMQSRPGPDDVTQLLYASGTTGEPKGVMHSANTLMANMLPYAERLRLGGDDVVFIGLADGPPDRLMYGLMMPIMLQASAVVQDVWYPAKAVELIRKEGATFTMASTPFLADLARAVSESGAGVPSLRTFLCAGAPIPGALVESARKTLGAKIVSACGMTENGAVTLIKPDDDELAVATDGSACPARK